MPLNLKSMRIAGVASLATLFLASAISAAAPAYTGNNSSTARVDSHENLRSTQLLKDLQVVTSELHRDAETLGTFATRPQLSWQSHASYLAEVRDQIDACHSKSLPPGRQQCGPVGHNVRKSRGDVPIRASCLAKPLPCITHRSS